MKLSKLDLNVYSGECEVGRQRGGGGGVVISFCEESGEFFFFFPLSLIAGSVGGILR